MSTRRSSPGRWPADKRPGRGYCPVSHSGWAFIARATGFSAAGAGGGGGGGAAVASAEVSVMLASLAGGRREGPAPLLPQCASWNCAASVLVASAVVLAVPPLAAMATASK